MIVEFNHPRHCNIFATSFAFFFLFLSGFVFAQPIAGKSQPDRLDFGTVRKDSTVEGSIRIFKDGDETEGESFNVQPPTFAKITSVELGTQTYGTHGTKIVCDISVAISTKKIGKFDGMMTVQVGSQKTTIPVKVNVLARDSSANSVLIVDTPFDKFSTDDATLFDPWLRIVETAKLDTHYLNATRDKAVLRELDLSQFDVILLGETGLVFLLDSDIKKLKEFVNDGGRLIVAANAFYRGTVAKANKILDVAGLSMLDTESRGINSFELTGNDIAVDTLTKAVHTVKCFRPSPISVFDRSKGRILVNASGYPQEGFVAAGKYGKGEIIAIGQSLWWSWIGDTKYKDSDNHQLMLNLVASSSK